MVFTNSIMITHVNKITNQPSMSLMATKGYKNANAMNSKGGYREPFTIIVTFFDHRNGHYVRPNKVAFNYRNFKKDVYPKCSIL